MTPDTAAAAPALADAAPPEPGAGQAPPPLPEHGEPIIEVRGLWSVFPVVGGGEVVVHKDLDLTVLRGEVLTLVGGSGTGKTVLLRQILGLNPPAKGTITVLGQTVTIALRLQGLTADLAYPVLVGPAAAHRIGLPFEQASLALKPLGSFLLPGLQHSCKVFTLRTLLQPGSLAEQSTLHYLHQHKNNVA